MGDMEGHLGMQGGQRPGSGLLGVSADLDLQLEGELEGHRGTQKEPGGT